MKVLKVTLSILALLVACLSGASSLDAALHWTPAVNDLLLASGAFLSYLGVSPFRLTEQAAKALSALSLMCVATVGAHAGGQVGGPQAVFKVIGFGGLAAGLMGRSPLGRQPQPAPAPAVPPPAA